MDYRIFNVRAWSFLCVRVRTHGAGHTDSDSSDFALNSDYYGSVELEAFRNPTLLFPGFFVFLFGVGFFGGRGDVNEEEKGDDDEDNQEERSSMTNEN